jgi:anti-sigma B factor antagonist
MKVRVEVIDQTTIVIAEGRLDFSAAANFQLEVEQELAGAGKVPTALIIDCAALEYVSSAGLRVFLLAARTAQRTGCWFAVCGLREVVREVFELSGFSRVMTVYPDRGAALAQVPRSPP